MRSRSELGAERRTLASVLVRAGLGDPACRAALPGGGRDARPVRVPGHGRGRRADPATRRAAAARSPCTETTTSTASARRRVLVRTLRAPGRRRCTRGCRAAGGRLRAVARAPSRSSASRGADLLVTTDCGIGAVEEVALARALGMDVVVTDHHRPATSCPTARSCTRRSAATRARTCARPASSTSSARRSSEPPGATRPSSSASSTSWRSRPSPTSCRCVGENRALVKQRPAGARRHRAAGAARADARCRRRSAERRRADDRFRAWRPASTRPGVSIAPTPALELLLTEDDERALEIARELDAINTERQSVETRDPVRGREPALPSARTGAADPVYVLAGEGWHPGVIGIVASRLVERYHRPFVLIALDGDGRGRGSGAQHLRLRPARRSRRVRRAPDALRRPPNGGGTRARGASSSMRSGAALVAHARAHLDRRGSRAGRSAWTPSCPATRVGLELAEELERLRPFGMGNPGVNLLRSGARGSSDVRPMGEGRHARFTVSRRECERRRSRSASAQPAGRADGDRRDRRSRPRSRGSRPTSGLARSSRGWCCARCTPVPGAGEGASDAGCCGLHLPRSAARNGGTPSGRELERRRRAAVAARRPACAGQDGRRCARPGILGSLSDLLIDRRVAAVVCADVSRRRELLDCELAPARFGRAARVRVSSHCTQDGTRARAARATATASVSLDYADARDRAGAGRALHARLRCSTRRLSATSTPLCTATELEDGFPAPRLGRGRARVRAQGPRARVLPARPACSRSTGRSRSGGPVLESPALEAALAGDGRHPVRRRSSAAACACWPSSASWRSSAQALPLNARSLSRERWSSSALERILAPTPRSAKRAQSIPKRADTNRRAGQGRLTADPRRRRPGQARRREGGAVVPAPGAADGGRRQDGGGLPDAHVRVGLIDGESGDGAVASLPDRYEQLHDGERELLADLFAVISEHSDDAVQPGRRGQGRRGVRASPASATPTSGASRARSSSPTRSAWRRSARACASTPRRSVRGAAARHGRGHERIARRRAGRTSATRSRQLVDGVTKLTGITFQSRDEQQAENYRKMMVAMATDIRVILIKLADRLHNMRTLDALPKQKQIEKAKETLDIFAPLAHRLGIHSIKWELEDLAFSSLHPRKYARSSRSSASSATEREGYVERAGRYLTQELEAVGIKADVSGPRQALLFDLLEDDQEGPRVQRDLRPHRDARDRRLGQGLLRRDRDHPLALEAAARPLQGLRRDAEVQPLPGPAHDRDRARGPPARDPDPHARRCTTRPSTASPRTGSTRSGGGSQAGEPVQAGWPASRRTANGDGGRRRRGRRRWPSRPGCGTCSTGSRSSRTRASSWRRSRSTSSRTRSSCSRRRAR